MSIIQSFTTAGLPARRRRAFWSEVNSRTFTALESLPLYPDDFNARLSRASLGALSLSEAASDPATVHHTTQAASHCSEHVFLLHLQAHGHSVHRQGGHEARLSEGDFTLCDSARPYSVHFDSPNQMLVLRIPAQLVHDRVTHAESLTALRIDGSRGIGGILSSVLRRSWDECKGSLEPQATARLGSNLVDLLVTALGINQPERTNARVADGHRLRIRYFIEDHLADPSLGVSMLAAAMGVTPRYIHRLFEHEPESVGQYVLRRRLQLAAQRLADGALAKRTILDIALSCGFSDGGYFSRAFRKSFKMTATEFRLTALQKRATP